MDDLEATRLCAEGMGWKLCIDAAGRPAWTSGEGSGCWQFNPLHDDAQAMALVKRFNLRIITYIEENQSDAGETGWRVWFPFRVDEEVVKSDLNRAIVYCVAKMRLGAKRERNDSKEK